MCCGLLQALYFLTSLSQQASGTNAVIILVLWVRKLKHREIKKLTQDHTKRKERSQGSNSYHLALNPGSQPPCYNVKRY